MYLLFIYIFKIENSIALDYFKRGTFDLCSIFNDSIIMSYAIFNKNKILKIKNSLQKI